MKSTTVNILVSIFITFTLTACGSLSSQNIQPTETMVAFLEESNSSDNPGGSNSEEIESEEENTSTVTSPQSGNWLWANSEPTYDNCPGDFSQISNPPDPPVEVLISMDTSGDNMQITSEGTVIELSKESFNGTISSYYGEAILPMPEGEELRVEYFLDYNFSNQDNITGTLISWLPAFDGCTATREVTAEFLGSN